MAQQRRAGALAALALVAALVLGACNSGPDKRFASDLVRPADVVERVSAPGSVQAAAQADLKAPAAARLDRLLVADGARVAAGQVVAQLSSAQVDAAIQQAQSAQSAAGSLGAVVPALPTGQALASLGQLQDQVSATSATVLQALRGLVGLLPPAQQGQASAQLDAAQRQIAAAQARADQAARLAARQAGAQASALRRSIRAATAAQRSQADLALALAEQQKAALILRAPIAGTVQLGRSVTAAGAGASVPNLPGLSESTQQALQGLAGGGGQATGPPLRAGSEVAAGQTVATVFDVGTLTVAAQVDETDVALVRPGEQARVELDAFPGAAFSAAVRRVAVAPSPGQSAAGGVTYEVDLSLGPLLEQGDDAGRPTPRVGMTATAEIEVRRSSGALSVPSAALIGRGSGQAVFVIEHGKVHLRPVRVGAEGEDRVAILSGVTSGERVVARGAERLRDGQDWPGA